jgi:hypothetical protein
VDHLARSGRLLLIVTLAWCAPPVKRAPVGVSTGGANHTPLDFAAPDAAPLDRLPDDFRARWNKASPRFRSEHGRFFAELYADSAPCADALHGRALPDKCTFVEDLFLGDAGAGVYLLERGDAGSRFAIGDTHQRTLADDARDAGTSSLDACARCHREAPRSGVFALP